MQIPTDPPEWVRDAFFYQIFPDRFFNGTPSNDPSNVHPWGAPPTRKTFFGGDLDGVIAKLPYLLDLGVNALYFNPIFKSASTHRYDTYDYFVVDPRLGDQGALQRLLRLAHEHDVRIVLDGVFNHCGRGFFPFHDLLENGPDSAHLDWFHVHGFPLYAYDETHPPNYDCWWNFRLQPKLNTDNPQVRHFLLSVARHWLELGIDGWRLDVPNEIDDDSFWQEFRAATKKVNPQAYLVGEIWFDGQRWLQGDQFDGITNYELRTALLEWLVEDKLASDAFARRLQEFLKKYRPETLLSQLNVLGSHDTPRLTTVVDGDLDIAKLLWLFVMTWPGAPCIYYGDEVGMTGGPDPECRACFPWDEADWNHDLRAYLQELIALRKRLPALRHGPTRILLAEPRVKVYAHGRGEGTQAVVMAMNASDLPRTFDLPLEGMEIPPGNVLIDYFRGERYFVGNGRLEGVWLEPRSGTILAGED
jgi:cyclomaltodextrinase